MRFLLVAHHAYVEPTNGAARSIRTIMEWLADAGHECTAMTSGRRDRARRVPIATYHDSLGVPVLRDETSGSRPVARYRIGGVEVTAIETEHPDRSSDDPQGDAQFAAAAREALTVAVPDAVLAYGSHEATQAVMAHARSLGIRTIFTVRAWGYDDPAYFAHADRVLLNSTVMVDHFRHRLGLHAEWLPSPMVWSEIVAPVETRGFVTFINPTLHKGALLFARLADMLGRNRPDIPMLLIQSAVDAAALARIPGLDLARYPQIMVSPPLAEPRDIYALSRILLVPSVFGEPFGRVAAEGIINGIPTIVSDRGALPETVGTGGIVLKLPPWMGPETVRVPDEADVRPWFDAIVRLWDDPEHYASMAASARQAGTALYDEATLRARYVAYFTDTGPFAPVWPTSA